MLLKQTLIVSTLCILFGCAGTDEVSNSGTASTGGGRTDCIFQSSIRGYRVLNESNLIISASSSRQYHIELQRRAFGLTSSNGIGFDSTSSRICAGFDEVVFKDLMGVDSIRIASIRELSPEDYDDLLVRFGKKEPEIKHTPAPREVKGAEVEELDPDAKDNSSGD